MRGGRERGRLPRGKQVPPKAPTSSPQLGGTRPGAPSRFQQPPPARKRELLCGGPPRSGLMQSGLLAKSGKQSPRKRGRGRGAAEASSGQVGARSRPLPSPPLPARHLQQQTSPPAPRPARPPAGRCPRLRLPSPAPCPAARLTSAKLPARETGKARWGLRSDEGAEPPVPWQAGHRRRSLPSPAAGRTGTRPRGAWEKPAQPRRAAAPHRAAPSSPGRRWCPPAASAPAGLRGGGVSSHHVWVWARGPGSQAPIAARRALAHRHTAAAWPRLGIPGRTDPFPPVFSPLPPIFTSL